MKKVLVTFTLGTISILVIAFVFHHKLYYPSLPIENISKKEVVEKINNSDKQIVKLTNENSREWYITSERNQSEVDEIIKKMVSQNGWTFVQKEGSGLFFEKQGEQLIITTQKWTGNYLLIKIPSNFHE
ncbi:hypothetical protein ACIQXF_00345 [Lysinibacillus sp. NPDC097231]|uniref:hypothetical protein n=1 Tax=Lysinibacillus sp. NPDC097231 TaxID=3364142 RepID=UPI0038287831